jgi:hypothetical protein
MEGVRLSSEFWRAAVERRCGGRCRLAADAPADEAESDLTRTGRSLGTLLLLDAPSLGCRLGPASLDPSTALWLLELTDLLLEW